MTIFVFFPSYFYIFAIIPAAFVMSPASMDCCAIPIIALKAGLAFSMAVSALDWACSIKVCAVS